MENEEVERQTSEEGVDVNEERHEDMGDEALMNNDQLFDEFELFIDIFAQQDLIDDENDCALATI